MKTKINIVDVIIRPEVIYPCPQCGSLFGRKHHLLKHLRQSECLNDIADSGTRFKFKFLKPLE